MEELLDFRDRTVQEQKPQHKVHHSIKADGSGSLVPSGDAIVLVWVLCELGSHVERHTLEEPKLPTWKSYWTFGIRTLGGNIWVILVFFWDTGK